MYDKEKQKQNLSMHEYLSRRAKLQREKEVRVRIEKEVPSVHLQEIAIPHLSYF